jgi:hypothetical protein
MGDVSAVAVIWIIDRRQIDASTENLDLREGSTKHNSRQGLTISK